MATIHVMSSVLASQVAAGEVVERPASVIKELVENSIDAGAKNIHIEIRRGGFGLIAVKDDGCGMSQEDARLCIQRHATSKLTDVEGLSHIIHLGFRGEALPSIASVSRFKLSTRRKNDLEGSEMLVVGGEEHPIKSSGISPGTWIEVADLFFNTPARRKFLKSPETEAAHIEHQIRLHALAYPQIRFTYKRDSQVIFDLPATSDLRVRIAALTDAAIADALIPIAPTFGIGVTVSGFLLPLAEARRSKKGQYVFLNTRPVEDRLLNRAIRDGFGGFPAGLHPSLFLYLEVEPALVDVNVHPAKREVRFRRSADIVDTVIEAISGTLQKHAKQEQATPPTGIPAAVTGGSLTAVVSVGSVAPGDSGMPRGGQAMPAVVPVLPPLRGIPIVAPPPVQTTLPLKPAATEKAAGQASTAPAGASVQGFTYLGMVKQLFVVFATADGLVLMSPKAARERIIFEQLCARGQREIESQQLLDPIVIDLDPRDFAVIQQYIPRFEQAGISISSFGQNTVRVESLPVFLNVRETRRFLLDLIDRLTQTEFSRNPKRIAYENFAAELAKKSAAHEQFAAALALPVLQALLACEVPYCTPAGKPTLINYSVPEIKRKFGVQA